MSQDDKQLYDLSRRKMLLGAGAVGVASLGAGLGTSALFSDTESFTNNSITAGTLDLSVTAEVMGASEYFSDAVGLSEVADSSEPTIGLQVDDVKPGDWAIICFTLENRTNPGYVQVSVPSDTYLNFDNDGNDPEEAVDGTTGDPGQGEGELQDAILASIWQDYDNSNSKSGLSVLDAWTNDEPDGTVNNSYAEVSQDDFQASDYGQTDQTDMDYPTLDEFATFLSGGQTIKNGDGSLFQVGYDNDGTLVGDGPAEFCLLLEIPAAVGNEIQSDSVQFDLAFSSEQVRNNPSPFDGDPNN